MKTLFVKEKSKNIRISIIQHEPGRISTHYVAETLGIVNQFKNNETPEEVIKASIEEIKNLLQDKSRDKQVICALEWIKKTLYEWLQPTLF